jgi:hypothetical protein
VSVNTRFQNTPKEKNNMLKDQESEGSHGMSPIRKMRCPGSMFRTGSTGQVSIATEVAKPEEKNADHLAPPAADLLSAYPVKSCQVPMGHPVYRTLKYQSVTKTVGFITFARRTRMTE